MNHNNPKVKEGIDFIVSLHDFLKGKDTHLCITAMLYHLTGIFKCNEGKKEDFIKLVSDSWDQR